MLSVQGLLKDKTVIFATHHLQWLPVCGMVVVLAEGSIAAQGPWDQVQHIGHRRLLTFSNGVGACQVQQHVAQGDVQLVLPKETQNQQQSDGDQSGPEQTATATAVA